MRTVKKLKVIQYRAFILSAILWLAIDLVSKYYVLHADFGRVTFIKNLFYISLQTNPGVAFGIKLGYIFQLIVSMTILGLLIYSGFKFLLTEKRNAFLNQFLLGIIVGGAIGNLVNRIHLGYVIDFIVLKPIPVFNIADIGITIGLIILFLLTFKSSKG
jgi:signal peptidase II